MKKTIFGITTAGAFALLLGFIFNAYDFTTYTLATTTFIGFIYGLHNKIMNLDLKEEADLLEMELNDVKLKWFKELKKRESVESEFQSLKKEVEILKFPLIDKEEEKVSTPKRKRKTSNTAK